ncbi:MAG: FkbM family methyltransferase [Candidatus Edwardsbacteria bacterium]|nr:FkbM family methyltransferase [Candidatus Edwardsbacteria bacterium]
MTIKRKLHKIMNGFGFDIVRYQPNSTPDEKLLQLLTYYKINTVIDIGASNGGYAKRLRGLGYRNKIISFEPLRSPYAELVKYSERDPLWYVHNYGFGNTNMSSIINVAENSDSSSLLEMLPAHEVAAPHAKYVGKEEIKIKKLDTVFSEFIGPNDIVYLKIDAQGYEHMILKGGNNSLEKINTIQVELSLIPLFKGQLTFDNLIDLLKQKGYTMVSVEPGFRNKLTGQLLQFDGIFHRY